MRDLLSWNLSLGRWAGVRVRLHVFFVIFAILALSPQGDPRYGAVALGILLASVLLHEIGHCVAARGVGGHADEILLWPFGGLAQVQVPHEPRSELVAALAGPLANVLLCLVAMPVLLLAGSSELLSLNPLRPPYVAPGFPWQLVVAMTFWINWTLLLMNLLPAFPLDGGRALRAILWPMAGYRRAVLQVSWVARLTGVALCIIGWLLYDAYPFAWIPLALLGVFLFFSAKQEAERLQQREAEEGSFGYDFSQGYTSLERAFEAPRKQPGPGPVRRWLEQRRRARQERQREIEEEEDRRVDDVLVRLHQHGLEGLSPEDRALLDRVSARYRNRH